MSYNERLEKNIDIFIASYIWIFVGEKKFGIFPGMYCTGFAVPVGVDGSQIPD